MRRRHMLALLSMVMPGCIDLDAPTACSQDPSRCLGTDDAAIFDGGRDAGDSAGMNDAPGDGSTRDGSVVDGDLDATAFDTGVTKGWHALPAVPSGFGGRYQHSSVWTGRSMIVFGGSTSPECGSPLNDGAAYDLAANSWTKIASAPITVTTGFCDHAAVWTGSVMLVWGGSNASKEPRSDGYAYEPIGDTWSPLPPSPLAARVKVRGAWATTTKEWILWGGVADSGLAFGDGAAFDPLTKIWRKLPTTSLLAGRSKHVMSWNGARALVWGDGSVANDGAGFDPVKNEWMAISAPPGFVARNNFSASEGDLFVFGGDLIDGAGHDVPRSDAAWFRNFASGWYAMPPLTDAVVTPAGRLGSTSWFDGSRHCVWSGAALDVDEVPTATSGGACFDGVTWTAMPGTGEPAPRVFGQAVWTGGAAIIWGGLKTRTAMSSDGGVYIP